MKSARRITTLSLMVLCCLVIFGCGKEDGGGSSQRSGETPTTTVDSDAGKTDVGTMDVEQLRTAALKCKADLEAKMAESEKIAQALIKSLSSDNTDERKKLNSKMVALNKEADVLGKQLDSYVAQIKAKGGDLSGLE